MIYLVAPHEDYLVIHTLWPEINKLYGHPHEICKLVSNSSCTVLASVCKALSKESASIILWSTREWKILAILSFHSYTVHALEFSPSDKLLASGSKDRKLAVFSEDFSLLYSYEAHLRVITCLTFSLSDQYIITGSRDKTLKLHSVSQRKIIAELTLNQPISAVAFSRLKKDDHRFVVGCLSGDIFLGSVEADQLRIDHQLAP